MTFKCAFEISSTRIAIQRCLGRRVDDPACRCAGNRNAGAFGHLSGDFQRLVKTSSDQAAGMKRHRNDYRITFRLRGGTRFSPQGVRDCVAKPSGKPQFMTIFESVYEFVNRRRELKRARNIREGWWRGNTPSAHEACSTTIATARAAMNAGAWQRFFAVRANRSARGGARTTDRA